MNTKLLSKTAVSIFLLFTIACGNEQKDTDNSSSQLNAGVIYTMADAYDWVLVSDRNPSLVEAIYSGETYRLFNAYREGLQYIRSGKREYGINLVWDTNGANSVIQIIKPNVSYGMPINNGGPVAIRISGRNTNDYGGYLYYKERKYGINLEFSSTPQYQWQISTQDGTVPWTKKFIRITNTDPRANSSIVWCSREYGINLKWQKDCSRKSNQRFMPY
ncbi:MAG: hypothetical protein HQK54_01540 [Oligoflexales bacterium]|nr:hypothetical protein [Oligoflexales bacterium]